MAKKMRRLLALVIALALCAGQIAVPAMAEETADTTPTVSVSVSQAPAASENMDVQVQDPVTQTTHDTAAGIITDTTSTTTTWTGTDENGNTVTGSETITEFTGTDDFTGTKLQEGGSVEGSETTNIKSETSESSTETIVTEEVTTTIENKDYIAGQTQTHTDKSSETTEGQWVTGSDVTEGDYIKTGTEQQGDTTSDTIGLGGIPEGGITIQLTPNTNTNNPYDFNGQVSGEIIPLEDAMNIPEGAVLQYDKDGNVIGYTLVTETQDVTTSEENGEAELAGTETDTTADISVVTPDLDVARNELGIINDNSVITEEYDAQDPGKINAYIVTNTEKVTIPYEYGMDALAKPADSVTTDASGNTVSITSQDITDEDGNVIGYTSRKVTTDANGKVIQDATTTQTIVKNDPPAAAEDVVTFTLPAKPAESTATDENGITTTVTVEEITNEGGDVIGYKSVTVVTDENGNELSRGSESIFGTTTTESESVKLDNGTYEGNMTVVRTTEYTYRITAEEAAYEDIATYTRLTNIVNEISTDRAYEIVEINGKLYWIFTGSMNVSEGEGHGDTSLMQPITAMSSLFAQNSDLDLDLGGDNSAANTNAPAEGFKYLGHGIDSALSVNKQSGATSANQFRLKSADGKIYFALCIDYDTTIKSGHLYDIEDIDHADYLTKATAEKIRSIALNGYWGTESGVGSLDEVKALLIDYLTGTKNMSREEAAAIANTLTPGQALAATQAALWKYGDSGTNNPILETNLIYNRGDNHVDEINAEYLYNALIAAANDPNATLDADKGVEFLDAEDITGGSITVKSKVVPAADAVDHANNDADPTNDVYNTDLSFTLGIEPSKLNGDLIVTVTVDGQEVKKVRLAGENALLPLGRITADENGVYTITDVELTEGVSVNLNLSGTQDLGTGVYIFTSLDGNFNSSQTLVTLATGERKVNLDLNMTFNVEEPTATKTSYVETEYGTRTDTRIDTRTDVTDRKEVTTKSESDQTITDSVASTKTYYADVTVTKVTTKEAKEERSWFSSWLKTYDPDPVPYHDDIPEGDILDEEVPLAAAPKTGDISALWAAVSLISLGGAVLLARKKENA